MQFTSLLNNSSFANICSVSYPNSRLPICQEENKHLFFCEISARIRSNQKKLRRMESGGAVRQPIWGSES